MANRSSKSDRRLDGGASRRRVLQAGLGGASLAAVGAVATGYAAEPEFEFRLQSFLGPGWAEWEELLPRYIERVRQASAGRIAITPFPPGQLVPTFDLLEAVGMHCNGGHAILVVNGHPMRGDRRRAGASMADANNRGVALHLDLLPGGRIVLQIHARDWFVYRCDTRHMLGKPRLHLVQKHVGVIESAVNQIDRLMIQRGEP